MAQLTLIHQIQICTIKSLEPEKFIIIHPTKKDFSPEMKGRFSHILIISEDHFGINEKLRNSQ